MSKIQGNKERLSKRERKKRDYNEHKSSREPAPERPKVKNFLFGTKKDSGAFSCHVQGA